MTLRWYFRECQYGRQFGDECYASIGSNGEQTLPQREARDGTLTAETPICDVHDSTFFFKKKMDMAHNLFLAHTNQEEGREAGGGRRHHPRKMRRKAAPHHPRELRSPLILSGVAAAFSSFGLESPSFSALRVVLLWRFSFLWCSLLFVCGAAGHSSFGWLHSPLLGGGALPLPFRVVWCISLVLVGGAVLLLGGAAFFTRLSMVGGGDSSPLSFWWRFFFKKIFFRQMFTIVNLVSCYVSRYSHTSKCFFF